MSEWKPYPFQEKVAQVLLSGKSIVLQAPTGAGKTAAALLPFIHAWRDDVDIVFPHKCVYVVPMRVLAHQFLHEYKEKAASIGRRFRRSLNVRIQTGDQPDDKRFEGDLIFCTVDQFISSYLMMPYSLPGRLANLNAGAIVGAYLVFDEFHLFDPGSTLPSVLYAVKQLRKIAPILLMTATFSISMLNALARELDAEVILVPHDEARKIETRSDQAYPRQRVWNTANRPLSAEVILSSHNNHSLALCNTVKGAQNLYRSLRKIINEKSLDISLLLLHSRFLANDRKETEVKLRQLFGKESDPNVSVIAVATQAIEVGVDISCETLHTELAPASALIQRAGRCARYPGEHGMVIIYPVDSYAPYGRETDDPDVESLWVKEMKCAWSWLQTHSGEIFDFEKEQTLVNAVATPRDEKVILELSAGSVMRTEAIHKVLAGDRTSGDTRLLVRDVDSRLVLIHQNPDELLSNPYNTSGFNLQTSTLYGMLNDWLERDIDVDWRVKRLIGDKNPDPKEDNHTEYGWVRLDDVSRLAGAGVIVVNPELAGYLKDEGFVYDRGNTGFYSVLPQDNWAEQAWEGYSYQLESYEDHIKFVLEAFHELVLPELEYPAHILEQVTGWSSGSVMRAAWLVCLFHDVGKLNKGWQNWARAYQHQIGSPLPMSYAVGHTNNERSRPEHKIAEKRIHGRHPKPNHAGEGAIAVSRIIVKALDHNEPLVKAALTAITRHHTPFARECKSYSLETQSKDHVSATLGYIPSDIRNSLDVNLLRNDMSAPPNNFADLLVGPEDMFGWMAYSILARALRRSDQAGTSSGCR